MFEGYQKNLTADYLWSSPCVQGDYARETLRESIERGERLYIYVKVGRFGPQDSCHTFFACFVWSEKQNRRR